MKLTPPFSFPRVDETPLDRFISSGTLSIEPRAARIARPAPFGDRLSHRGPFSRFFDKRGY